MVNGSRWSYTFQPDHPNALMILLHRGLKIVDCQGYLSHPIFQPGHPCCFDVLSDASSILLFLVQVRNYSGGISAYASSMSYLAGDE